MHDNSFEIFVWTHSFRVATFYVSVFIGFLESGAEDSGISDKEDCDFEHIEGNIKHPNVHV